MRNKFLLDMLFEKTFSDVKDRLGDDINEEQYYTYLSKRYSEDLKKIRSIHGTLKKSDKYSKDIVDSYAEKEERRWHDISNSDMLLSIIDPDEAFWELEGLAAKAKSQAHLYGKYGITYIGEKEYKSKSQEYKAEYKELIKCMYNIKPYNITLAKKFLLDAILDFNFAYMRSSFNSNKLNDIANKSV